MCRLKFRLLVALLTFGVGVGFVSFLNAFSSAPVRLEDVPAPSMSGGHKFIKSNTAEENSCECAITDEARDNLFMGMSRFKKPVFSGGILQNKAVSMPKPPYPPLAKAARASGTVTVQIIVGEEGRVIAARPVSGHPLLQEAAAKAACQARFSPILLSGKPVRFSGVITYHFVLQ